MKGQFIIKRVSKGFKKGEFRFILRGTNHEIIAHGETYTQKHNVVSLHKEYFSSFELIDKTKE